MISLWNQCKKFNQSKYKIPFDNPHHRRPHPWQLGTPTKTWNCHIWGPTIVRMWTTDRGPAPMDTMVLLCGCHKTHLTDDVSHPNWPWFNHARTWAHGKVAFAVAPCRQKNAGKITRSLRINWNHWKLTRSGIKSSESIRALPPSRGVQKPSAEKRPFVAHAKKGKIEKNDGKSVGVCVRAKIEWNKVRNRGPTSSVKRTPVIEYDIQKRPRMRPLNVFFPRFIFTLLFGWKKMVRCKCSRTLPQRICINTSQDVDEFSTMGTTRNRTCRGEIFSILQNTFEINVKILQNFRSTIIMFVMRFFLEQTTPKAKSLLGSVLFTRS